VRRLESVGAALLGEAEAEPISEAALARTLARLDEPLPSQAERGTLDDLLRPATLEEVAPGVRIAKIDTPHEAGACVMLVSIDAGFGVARHGHRGAEFTHVISGALSEEGEIWRPGDFMERGADVAHTLSVCGDEPCVCVVAARGFIWA
jgi:putative transcriptional regulator